MCWFEIVWILLIILSGFMHLRSMNYLFRVHVFWSHLYFKAFLSFTSTYWNRVTCWCGIGEILLIILTGIVHLKSVSCALRVHVFWSHLHFKANSVLKYNVSSWFGIDWILGIILSEIVLWNRRSKCMFSGHMYILKPFWVLRPRAEWCVSLKLVKSTRLYWMRFSPFQVQSFWSHVYFKTILSPTSAC